MPPAPGGVPSAANVAAARASAPHASRPSSATCRTPATHRRHVSDKAPASSRTLRGNAARWVIRRTPPRAARGVRVAAGASTCPPYELTWSNPTGSVLTECVPGMVWAAERPFVWNGIDVGGKMGVVRLADGSLWVHSPVGLDEPLRDALAALGEVKHVVSPNYEHVKWAAQWKAAYPAATLWGSPGMKAKKVAIPYDCEVGAGNESPKEWLGEIDVAFFDCETTPIVGGAFFNEVLFVHKPSRCVMVTDLFWNYPSGSEVPLGTRLWKFGMDEVYLPFYRKYMVDRPEAFRAASDRVLGWDFDAMLPCHGSFIGHGAKDVMRKHLVL